LKVPFICLKAAFGYLKVPFEHLKAAFIRLKGSPECLQRPAARLLPAGARLPAPAALVTVFYPVVAANAAVFPGKSNCFETAAGAGRLFFDTPKK
jgi:hypothetical protein